jgi:hypothetical protein
VKIPERWRRGDWYHKYGAPTPPKHGSHQASREGKAFSGDARVGVEVAGRLWETRTMIQLPDPKVA